MSETKRTRRTKSKTAEPVAEAVQPVVVPVEPESVVAPVVPTVDEVVEPTADVDTADESADDDGKVVRKQLSKCIGVDLSVSRVRRCLDKLNVNAHIERANAEIKAHETTPTEPYTPETKLLLDQVLAANNVELKNCTTKDLLALTAKGRCRFSNNALLVLTAGLDYIVQVLLRDAMTATTAASKTNVQGLTTPTANFGVYSFVERLPCMRPDAVVAASPVSFDFYVGLIYKRLKAEAALQNVRVGQATRKLCSDIVVDAIARLSPLLVLYVESVKVKTVTDVAVRFVFKALLADAGHESDTALDDYMQTRYDYYHKK